LSAIGSIAGVLAGFGASAIGWLLAHQVLHFEYHLSAWPFAAGIALGAVCATAGGLLALRRVIATPPGSCCAKSERTSCLADRWYVRLPGGRG